MERYCLTRIPNGSPGLTQTVRGKFAMSLQDDAACFLRLASGETAMIKGQNSKNAPPSDLPAVEEASVIATNFAGYEPPILSIKTMEPKERTVQVAVPETGCGSQHPHLKKPKPNAEHGSESLERKAAMIERKPQFHVSTLERESYLRSAAEYDAKSVQTAMSIQSEIVPNIVGNLRPVGLAHGQIATQRVNDLPHVTRVHIDQIKRNATGVLTSLELVLEPAELGRITARIQHKEGSVTLVLSAEHSSIANDLAQDNGLLLRVLGDQLPGIHKVTVSVETEAQREQVLQGQSFPDFKSSHREHRQAFRAREGFDRVSPNGLGEPQPLDLNTTGLHIRV
jgi:hypothetical protein